MFGIYKRKTFLLAGILLLAATFSLAQEEKSHEKSTESETPKKWSHLLSFSAYAGDDKYVAAFSWEHKYAFGNKGRLKLGYGARANYFFADRQRFVPSLNPSQVYYDISLIMRKTEVTSINLGIYASYNPLDRLALGFNIDAVGYSFGKEQNFSATLYTPSYAAKPTAFNLLLGGKQDKGSLNSEFSIGYRITKKLGIKTGYSLFFTEYTTETAPLSDGNNRFRLVGDMLFLGLNLKLF